MSIIIELVTHEKIVAELVSHDNVEIVVESPFAIVPVGQDPAGQQTFGLLPWPMFRKSDQKTFSIRNSAIILSYTPNDKLDQNYRSNKSNLILPPTGVETPKPSSLILG